MPKNSGTSTVIPLPVRAMANGFQNNCAVNNLIPDIAYVVEHHEADIAEVVRQEAVEAFNRVWKTNINWNRFKEILLETVNPVRREVLFGPVLRQMTTDDAIKKPRTSGYWEMMTSVHAAQVARKFNIQVEEYRTNEVTQAEVDRYKVSFPGSSVPVDMSNPDFNQLSSPANQLPYPVRRCRLLNVGGHFSRHGSGELRIDSPTARTDTEEHNEFYADGVMPKYQFVDPILFPKLQTVVSRAASAASGDVEGALKEFETTHGLHLDEDQHKKVFARSSDVKENSLLEVLTPELRQNIKAAAEEASKKIGEMLGTDSRLFAPLFSAIPKLLSGVVELFAWGTPIFMQLKGIFKQFSQLFVSPGVGLTDDEVVEFSKTLQAGMEAADLADFAQYTGVLESGNNRINQLAKDLNGKVKEELRDKKQISPELWIKLISLLNQNGFVEDALDCLKAREKDLLERLAEVDSEDGALVALYKRIGELFSYSDFATASDKVKADLFQDKLSFFKLFNTAFLQLAPIAADLKKLADASKAYKAEGNVLSRMSSRSEAEEQRYKLLCEEIDKTEALIKTLEERMKMLRGPINADAAIIGKKHGHERSAAKGDMKAKAEAKAKEDKDKAEANAREEKEAADLRMQKARNEAEKLRIEAEELRRRAAALGAPVGLGAAAAHAAAALGGVPVVAAGPVALAEAAPPGAGGLGGPGIPPVAAAAMAAAAPLAVGAAMAAAAPVVVFAAGAAAAQAAVGAAAAVPAQGAAQPSSAG